MFLVKKNAFFTYLILGITLWINPTICQESQILPLNDYKTQIKSLSFDLIKQQLLQDDFYDQYPYGIDSFVQQIKSASATDAQKLTLWKILTYRVFASCRTSFCKQQRKWISKSITPSLFTGLLNNIKKPLIRADIIDMGAFLASLTGIYIIQKSQTIGSHVKIGSCTGIIVALLTTIYKNYKRERGFLEFITWTQLVFKESFDNFCFFHDRFKRDMPKKLNQRLEIFRAKSTLLKTYQIRAGNSIDDINLSQLKNFCENIFIFYVLLKIETR